MPIWLLLTLTALALLALAWFVRLRWKPAYALRLALLALAFFSFPSPLSPPPSPPPPRQVLILDQSDSIPPQVRADTLAQARTWQAASPNRLVILAGTQAHITVGDHWPAVNGRATRLAEALVLAANLLGNVPGQIILATDGRPTDPLAVQSLISNRLKSALQSPIQIIPLDTFAPPNDLFVAPLYAPTSMWQGLTFQAVLPIYAPQPAQAALQLFQNGELLAEETISLQQGLNLRAFNLQTSTAEILTLQAALHLDADPRPENNAAYAAVRVYPAPRLLVVTEDLPLARDLAASTGLQADFLPPGQLPASLAELDPYQVIILHNFLASRLTDAQMRALKDFAFQLGRGLIFLGGHNAYTLGGYKDTLLEPLLPVRLEPPPRPQTDALTFVLAFDRSSSMGAARGQRLAPLVLAREAALRAIETLGPTDRLGLLAYSSDPAWIVPISPLGQGDTLQRARDALSQVTASGGTSIYKALNEAVNGLLAAPASGARHILLLSDGQSADGTLEEFIALAQFARQQSLTLSTIALGAEADQELMALLAEAGGGRYYPVQQAADLPKILVDESQAARGDNLVEGEIRPVEGEPNHPILSGFRTALLPPLAGYNALQSKASLGAEDVLVSADFGDPLLSIWQVGLGRVAAWMGDIGETWGAEWAAWPDRGRFWSQLILYALPDPSLGPGQVEVDVHPETVHLTARLQTPTGIPLNNLQVVYFLSEVPGDIRAYQMLQTAPGLYELTLPRPAEGVYRGVVSYKPDGTQTRIEIAAPLVINYPAEWQPPAPEPGAAAQTGPRLQAWAVAIGGAITTWEAVHAPLPSAPTPAAPEESLSRFLLALLLLWPVEIALRRRWMPWR